MPVPFQAPAKDCFFYKAVRTCVRATSVTRGRSFVLPPGFQAEETPHTRGRLSSTQSEREERLARNCRCSARREDTPTSPLLASRRRVFVTRRGAHNPPRATYSAAELAQERTQQRALGRVAITGTPTDILLGISQKCKMRSRF